MKFSSPAAAALAGPVQAPIETGKSHQGIASAVDLAIQVNPPLTPVTPSGSAPLQRICFRSALKAPQHQLRGGDAVTSLN